MKLGIWIRNAEVYAPEALGQQDVLIIHHEIAHLGPVDGKVLEQAGWEFEIVEAQGCYLTPGLIDPHEHLIGGSGERSFASATPEIALHELIDAGITTVVGCLGVDTHSKNMPALLARAKALNEEGLSAYLYTGGYDIPARTLTGSVRTDLMWLSEVIGAGETAVSDFRSSHASVAQLAQLVGDAYVGGILSGKAGVTHLHMGDGKEGLKPIRTLLNDFEIKPEAIYPTHVERNTKLMDEAIALTREGITIDLDTYEEDLPHWIRYCLSNEAGMNHITASSDAAIRSPSTLTEQLIRCLHEVPLPFERVLPLATTHTARILKLPRKGRVAAGMDADLLIWSSIESGTDWEIRDVIAKGRFMKRNGVVTKKPASMLESNRKIELNGQKKKETR